MISHGKNGYGAVNIKGGKNDYLTAAGTDEKQNITFTLPSTVVKRDASDAPTGNAFDDGVMILSANDLTGPLIANGTLQSNAQAALSQANDIVMGNIVATKAISCPVPTCPPNPESYRYNILANTIFTTPPNVVAWGVSHTQGASNVNMFTTPATAVAYTLTAGDGATKTVSIGELQGILARAAGFN